MKLVRNETQGAQFKDRVIRTATGEELRGGIGGKDECFVLLLKDRYAQAALKAYAAAAQADDPEYAAEIEALAARSGPDSPFCKTPD